MALFSDIAIPGNIVKVNGEKKDRAVYLFSLSTCVWCKMSKSWLTDHNIEYRYVDVDLLNYAQKEELKDQLYEVFSKNIIYPFLVIDGKDAISGFHEDQWEELLNVK